MSESASESAAAEPAAASSGAAAGSGAAADPSASYGPIQLRRALGLSEWQVQAAWRRGLMLRAARPDGRWSQQQLDELSARVPQIRAAVGDVAPAGARRMAERAAAASGLAVEGYDLTELAERGLIEPCGDYKGWDLYDAADVDAAVTEHRGALAEIVAARQEWEATSLPVGDACARLVERLGWRWSEAKRVLEQRRLVGRQGRVALADVDAIAADAELDEAVQAARLLGPDQAAAHLEIRRSDFNHLWAAGWVEAAGVVETKIGRKWVTIRLFRAGDLDAVREEPPPGVDWGVVRGARPGERSSLLELRRRPGARTAGG